MEIKVAYKIKVPSCESVEDEILQKQLILEIPHNSNIYSESERYLLQYFSKYNFQITEIKVIDKN